MSTHVRLDDGRVARIVQRQDDTQTMVVTCESYRDGKYPDTTFVVPLLSVKHIPLVNYDQIPKLSTPTGQGSVYHWRRDLGDTIERWIKEYDLDLSPDFQRGHVWSESQQRAYVEYVLRNGSASKTIYFNHPDWNRGWTKGRMEIVDGKQRLEAVQKFMRGDLAIFGDLTVDSFHGGPPAESAFFIFQVHNLPTRAKLLKWYLDLNSGGVIHTDDELNRVRGLLVEAEAREVR